MVTKPAFMVTIDVELGWGFIGKKEDPGFHALIRDNSACRDAVNFLLNVFEKYRIAATWAIVGHLFLNRVAEANTTNASNLKHKDRWAPYGSCVSTRKDLLYYGRDIIEKVLSSPIEHEIGYHSFSHINFSKCSREVAEDDIRKGVNLANDFGIKLESFVFPYNKIGHLDVLKKYGFRIYRGRNLGRWDVEQNRTIQMINGILDQMAPPSPVESRWVQGLLEIPSSMVFSGQFPFTRLLALRCIFGINNAIRSNKIFHVALHPWNMLFNSIPEEFEKLLRFVSRKRGEGRLSIIRMKDLAYDYYEKKQRFTSESEGSNIIREN